MIILKNVEIGTSKHLLNGTDLEVDELDDLDEEVEDDPEELTTKSRPKSPGLAGGKCS